MSSKFVIRKQHAASRWEPIGKYKITRSGDCINCGKCVRLCIFEVHKRSEEDYRKMADPGDYKCKNCFMCIQGCTRGALSMSLNPAYLELGDGLYTPEIITSLMKQAETGEIPVSGTGYGGRFSAAGFDALWTDMSEIVRPTRDGIHGREYISTTVDLGRKPLDVKGLRFDPYGNPLTNIPPTVEIKLPIIFDRLPFLADHPNILLAQAKAATVLGTFTIVEQKNFSPELEPYSNHLIMSFSPEEFSWKELVEMAKRHSLLEVAYSPDITGLVSGLKKINPDLLFIVRIENHWEIEKTVTELGQSQVAMFHLHVEGTTDTQVLPEIIHRVHRLLVAQKLRDSVTVIASGQIAAAEHVPKAILLGADAVAVDRPTLIALECTLCKKCLQGQACPRLLEEVEPDWGAQRMVNLMASWHNQLLEVLGAMGLREVSRLRGEMGRAMFKEALEEETFKKIFVKYPEAVKDTVTVPPLLNNINDISTPTDGGRNFRFLAPLEMTNNRNCDQTRIGAPSRFNRPLARFKVLRGPSCIACGTCEKVCPQGVHRRPLGFNRMAEPEHHKCLGFSCSASLESCVALCPRKALSVTINPQHQALGDYRWTPDMILAVYQMAETGEEPHLCGNYHCGNSGGGFDRIRFRNIHFDSIWPTTERTAVNYAPIAEIETSIDLNRRGEGPEIRIPIPIYGGGMSFGSVSLNTMLARAMAAKELDTFTCPGEGGYPEELIPYA
ncbi:MAG: glutamate synthase-related protein, partial [candidate division KSB1 bacterium]|nr:glutamate synthase-related protein [candidate division KSB1 bacterium]